MSDAGLVRVVGVNDSGHVIGQDHHRAKFRDHEIDLMIDLHAVGLSYRQIADKFECSKAAVRDYCKGRRRAHLVVEQKRLLPPVRRRFTPARAQEFDLIL